MTVSRPYGCILVGTDGSESARAAVLHAAQLARVFGAPLRIVSAFATLPGLSEAAGPPGSALVDGAAARAAAEAGAELAATEAVHDVEVRVVEGPPAEVIVDSAIGLGADLIVMGSKGMSPGSRFLLGSIPNKVSHHAPCDIIIVRTST